MLTKGQFDSLFDRLLSNPWKYLPEKSRLEGTKNLFYDKLSKYDFLSVRKAFEAILADPEQQCMPSLQRIVWEIERFKPEDGKVDLPKADSNRRAKIKKLIHDTREIIVKYGNDKPKLKALGEQFLVR